ncbi:unnamed protein product [Phytophthora fragariaefolia]|uniref:Unnamed protein product n=1 Tax=Phytophthora fragariaefolia TaxID=1490495 RepID=A0A9W6Y4T4_9STRA|nr:unnamed protein product [Phytophthora fragariaefolia]
MQHGKCPKEMAVRGTADGKSRADGREAERDEPTERAVGQNWGKSGGREASPTRISVGGGEVVDKTAKSVVDEQEDGGADGDTSRSGDVASVSAAEAKRAARISSGTTPAEKRRKEASRGEAQVGAAQDVLLAEFRERREQRAVVLRVKVRQEIAELREQADGRVSQRCRRTEAQVAAAVVRRAEEAKTRTPHTKVEAAVDGWLADVHCDEAGVPLKLEEMGTLHEMRAVRRDAVKRAKQQRVARREERLERRKREQRAEYLTDGAGARPTTDIAPGKRRRHKVYKYEKQGCYGDVELMPSGDGKSVRVVQLRTADGGEPSCLPTVLLALTKTHTQEVRLDTCAEYSVVSVGLRQYGRCVSRSAPVDVVEGFGGGTSRVLGVWRFSGTTPYRQRITIDVLVVDTSAEEFLVGEDWMVERQCNMNFRTRELRYIDADGEKVSCPFTCRGVTTLQQAGRRKALVRVARTAKLGNNTYSIVVRMTVNAEDGTTGIFLPKSKSKQHLLVAPTVDTALGTWIPTDDTMKLLEMNGELQRTGVAEWVATLNKQAAEPLKEEDKLDIGEMEPADRDLVVTLLHQFAELVEKKQGCPPLSKTGVEHHINTGSTAPNMLRRRRHAVAENEIIDKEVSEMLMNGVIEEGQGAWGFPVVLVRKKDGSVRFRIDYRALNDVTIKDVYTLPRVDETLEALHGSQRYTSLDLHSGYWQLGVAKEDKEKTDFTTRRGLFQFLRMPIGLCNEPSTFQRLMGCVL